MALWEGRCLTWLPLPQFVCRMLLWSWREENSACSLPTVCLHVGCYPRSSVLTLHVSLVPEGLQHGITNKEYQGRLREIENLDIFVPLMELFFCILNREPCIFIFHGALKIMYPILIGMVLSSAVIYYTQCPLVFTASSYICFKFQWHNKKIFSETV